MVVSTRLSRLWQTSHKHPRSDNASTRPGIEECLPPDALEAIMGHLDQEALCPARLVSKAFCAAASAHVCNLTLASTSQALSFHRFPHLRHVTVTHLYGTHMAPRIIISGEEQEKVTEEEENLAQIAPCLRDITTALTIRDRGWGRSERDFLTQTRDYLSQGALMPNLRKLDVEGDVRHEAALLARCTNLEALALRDCNMSVARTIVTMTRLTSLHIRHVSKDGSNADTADTSWLGHATNLGNLQALSIRISNIALPLVGNLTGLTGLTVFSFADEGRNSIAPLTHLTRLRSLRIGTVTDNNLQIACSLGSGALGSLQLYSCEEASADWGRYLSCQTALTRLCLDGQQLCNLQNIRAFRIELLHCLELDFLDTVDAEGLCVLSRATRLTRLSIETGRTQPQMGLSQALAQLTQLRSLSLSSWQEDPANFLDFPLAVSPLTALTELHLGSFALDDGDLRALLHLTGLRVLELSRILRLTDGVLPDLGVLTNLSSLTVPRGRRFRSLAPVSEVLDPLREARGLPPLRTVMR